MQELIYHTITITVMSLMVVVLKLFFTAELRKKVNELLIIILIYSCFHLTRYLTTFFLDKNQFFFNNEYILNDIIFYLAEGFVFLIFYLLFIRQKRPDFFRLNINKDNLSSTIVACSVLLIYCLIALFFEKRSFETYEIVVGSTIDVVSQEIWFRGILLSLLLNLFLPDSKVLNLKSKLISLFIGAVIFGMMHALSVDEYLVIHFSAPQFFWTLFPGFFFGWLTIRTVSLIPPILLHSVANFMIYSIVSL